MTGNDNVVPLQTPDPIDAEAAMWLARLDNDELTGADRAELRAWLLKDDRHREALSSYLSIWGDLDEIVRDVGHADAAPRPGFANFRLALAGSFAAVFALIGSILFVGQNFREQPDRSFEALYATGLGEYKEFMLPDGSHAAINSDTKIFVDFSNDERNITLASGEAEFTVFHDAERRFRVFANGRVVEAVGTAFVVRIDGDKTLVSVTEGKVRFGEMLAPLPEEVLGASSAQQPMLVAQSATLIESGEEAVADGAYQEIRSFTSQELQKRLAWKDGRMIFDGEPLREVIDEFSRHSRVKIELDEPAYGDLQVTGNFVLGDVDAFLEAVEITIGVHAEWVDDSSVLITADAG